MVFIYKGTAELEKALVMFWKGIFQGKKGLINVKISQFKNVMFFKLKDGIFASFRVHKVDLVTLSDVQILFWKFFRLILDHSMRNQP